MNKAGKEFESPLSEDGSINQCWEEVEIGSDRLAGQLPRFGEVYVGIQPTRIFRRKQEGKIDGSSSK